MTNEYDWLKLGNPAPLYRWDGRPIIRMAKQLCLSFPVAAAHNFDLIRSQGTIPLADEADPNFADKAWLAMRGKFTSQLLGNASSADLFFFNPCELLVVSADGDLLMTQRSHRGASEGMINHFAGGFPNVITDTDGSLVAEPKKETALRETREELGWRINNAVDLNCMTYDNTITAMTLAKKDGGKYIGFAPEIMQRFSYHWPASTDEILQKLTTKPDSVGMTVIRLKDLEGMLRGDTEMNLRFVPNSLPFAKRFIDDATRDGKTYLSEIRQALLDAGPMTPEERSQKDGKFDPATMREAIAGRDVFYEPNYFSGLAAFRAAAMPLSPFALNQLEQFRYEERAKMIKPFFGNLPSRTHSFAPTV